VSLQNNGKTIYTFDGRSTAYGPDGAVIAEMPAYARETLAVEVRKRGKKSALTPLEGRPKPAVPDGKPLPEPDRIREIHQALRYGARAFLASMRVDKV